MNDIFRRIAIASLFCSCLTVAFPYASRATAAQIAPVDPVAEQANHDADYALRHGRNFTYAIAKARKAVALCPTVSRYHRTLGCALASRVAAIGVADRYRKTFESDLKQYKVNYSAWLQAQQANAPVHGLVSIQDQEVQLHMKAEQGPPTWWMEQMEKSRKIYEAALGPGTPQPQEPVLRTKDDDQPFNLTHDEANAEIDHLAEESSAEFALSVKDASGDKETAEALATQSLGMMLLSSWHFFGTIAPTVRKDVKAETKTILDGLKKAADLQPQESLYWQALGDATLYHHSSPVGKTDRDAAVDAYRHALALPHRAYSGMGIRIYYLLAPTYGAATPADIRAAQKTLEDVSHHESDNPLPLYYSALLLLPETVLSPKTPTTTETPDTRPLELVEQANALSFQFRNYPSAVPPALSAAWALSNWIGTDGISLRDTSNAFSALSDRLIARYMPDRDPPVDRDLAIRACQAVITMGENQRLSLGEDVNAWSYDQKIEHYMTLQIEEPAYLRLIACYQMAGDEANARATEAALEHLTDLKQQAYDNSMAKSSFGYSGNY